MADKPYHCVAWIHGGKVSGYLSCTRNEERAHSHLIRLRKQGRKNIGIVERDSKPRGVKAPPKLRKQPQGSLFPSDDPDTPQGSLFGSRRDTAAIIDHAIQNAEETFADQGRDPDNVERDEYHAMVEGSIPDVVAAGGGSHKDTDDAIAAYQREVAKAGIGLFDLG